MVPKEIIGRLIGPNGSTLKRLVQSTGCKIEIPRAAKGEEEPGEVAVQLLGGLEQRRKAAVAVRDMLEGGEAEDHAARADGAMVIKHSLEDHERRSWLAWKLVPTEHEQKIRVDMGRNAVRIWKSGRGPALTGAAAGKVRAAAEAAIAEARELVELNVDVPIENEPENVGFDAAVRGLTEQYGVLLRFQEAEEDKRPVRVWGPAEPARDAALMVEARWVKGKSTSSLLQAPGQVQAMNEEMTNDFNGDIRSLESESSVKVHMGHTVIWISGANAEAVLGAKETLRQMLQFYLPDGFSFNENMGQKEFVDQLRQDPELRFCAQRPGGAMNLDSQQCQGWLCGEAEYREKIEKRIEAMQKKWATEHWEIELDNYGVAMWLLGPNGTGGWLQRMKTDCGAEMKVCPNALKAWVEGPPSKVEAGKALILEGLEKLEEKRKADEDISVQEVATKKQKKVLTEHPPHMQAVLDSLRLLEARELEMKRRARMRDWDNERPPGPAAAAAARAEPPAAAASASADSPAAGGQEGRIGDDTQRDDWQMLRGLRTKIHEAAVKPQTVPEVESRAAGIGRMVVGAAADAVIQEPEPPEQDKPTGENDWS